MRTVSPVLFWWDSVVLSLAVFYESSGVCLKAYVSQTGQYEYVARSREEMELP